MKLDCNLNFKFLNLKKIKLFLTIIISIVKDALKFGKFLSKH